MALRRVRNLLLLLGIAVPAALAQSPEATGTIEAPPDARGAALARQLAEETRRAEQAGRALTAFETSFAERRAAEAAELQSALDEAAELQLRLSELPAGSAETKELYRSTVERLRRARAAARAALDARSQASSVPGYTPRADLSALSGSTLARDVGELERRLAAIAEREAELRRQERLSRRTAVARHWEVVRRLNDVRVRALELLPAADRRETLGLTRTGIGQLRRELDHVALAARVYAATRGGDLAGIGSRLRDVFTLGSAAWIAFKVVLVLLAYAFLRTRGPQIDAWLQETLVERPERMATRRRFERLLSGARVVTPWLLLLGVLAAVRWALGRAAEPIEIRLALNLALLYVVYRLSIDSLVAAIVGIVRRYRLRFGAQRTSKLLHCVRLLARVVFAVWVLMYLSAALLGRGYLHHVVFRLSWIAVIVALLVVFNRWREDIAQAYIDIGPPGRLKRHVEAGRHRWYGGLAAAGALGFLAGRALLQLVQDFVLGFDQTRRALAFLFRRRIEKHAELTGYADQEAKTPLPEALVRALTEEPVDDERLLVDRFPGMDELKRAVAEWRESGVGGSFLLTGNLGVGRTSWLGHFSADDLPIRRIVLDRRIDHGSELAAVLGSELGLGEVGDLSTLRDRLQEQPPQAIVVDRGQRLFLGRVGGYAGFESFMSLVEDTSSRVFWIAAFSQGAWEHVAAVHPHLAGFHRHQQLDAWSEEEILELIRKRSRAAGVEVDYRDLVLDSAAGLPRRAVVSETEEGYARLLWDYCLGLPRAALCYWRRSLVPDGENRVRVRLFRTPPVERLEQMGDVPLFLLAAIMVHESLSVREMSVVSRYSEPLCRIQANRLAGLGVLTRDKIRWRPTSYWYPAVLRVLKRRNLLSD